MTIRKIVLIPSLLLLASVAWLAFRPQPASPDVVPAARATSAPTHDTKDLPPDLDAAEAHKIHATVLGRC